MSTSMRVGQECPTHRLFTKRISARGIGWVGHSCPTEVLVGRALLPDTGAARKTIGCETCHRRSTEAATTTPPLAARWLDLLHHFSISARQTARCCIAAGDKAHRI